MASDEKVTTPMAGDDAHARLRETAADLAKADNEVALESLSQWQLAWRRFRRHKMAMIGAAIFIIIIAIALVGPYLVPFEITSVLLLAAVVGAVVLAKRRL